MEPYQCRSSLLEASRGNTRDHALISLLISSGLRVGELSRLEVGNILGKTISVINGKGMKHRVTFMDGNTEDAISNHLLVSGITSGFLFPGRKDSITRMAVLKIIQKYVGLAKSDKHISVHSLRHTFATNYLMRGGRVEDLQQMLGHTNINTTMLYLHFTNSHLHSEYDKIMSVSKTGHENILT